VQPDGVRYCSADPRSTVKSFDGVPVDVSVALPARAAGAPDGAYPLVMLFHGYGGAKVRLPGMQRWLDRGYATLSLTARGFGESCGTSAARGADPAGCAAGYVRFADVRYEVRDAQELAGLLVDEGLVQPTRIGAAGGSYGGAIALSLAALRDRKALPDGTLVPWTSRAGVPMQIAVAAPRITWSDFAYAMMPNGSTLDYLADAPYTGPTGVRKQSQEDGLYGAGLAYYYAPEGADPDADIWNWHASMAAGEPYDDPGGVPLPAVADMIEELTAHHSPYYIDHSQPPAPLLLSNGWTDDLFPVDEAIRYYNRTRTEHPATPIAMYTMDYGHPRGQAKIADRELLDQRRQEWFDHYLLGTGPAPSPGVEALTQTCPSSAPSGGPYRAPTLAALAPGEVTLRFAEQRIVFAWGGDQAIADAFDPYIGGDACVTTPGDDQPGAASYRMAPAPPGGFTLMGSPTVIADIATPAAGSQIAARVLDVAPSGRQTLVARGVWRPAPSASPLRQVFQLHPNGWRFAEGHVAKLELLSKDSPYAQASTSQAAQITVENVEWRLPVVEQPGALAGLVREPAAKVLPAGGRLARDFWPPGYPRPRGASPLAVALVPSYVICSDPSGVHGPPLAYGACPPRPASGHLTVGTPDANGAEPGFVGTVRLVVAVGSPATPADDADVRLDVDLADVRRQEDLSDYTGELRATFSLRLTDQAASGASIDSATMQSVTFPMTVPCNSTADPQVGGTCALTTTLDAALPGAVPEGRRSIWQIGDIRVQDGGADGIAATAPNALFARQGLFVP
jgi:predicted acyl esterase